MFRKRVLANVIDYLIMMLLFMLINIIPFYDDYVLLNEQLSRGFYIVYFICLVFIYVSFIWKDLIKGQSIGKRIVGICVVNKKGKIPNVFRLFVRNITFYIWPVEVLLMLLDKKRLGDRIAGTEVVKYENKDIEGLS